MATERPEKKTRIVIVGAAGRMGRAILACATEPDAPFAIEGAVEAVGHPMVGRPLNAILPAAPQEVSIADAMPQDAPPGSVAIQFTTPAQATAHLEWAASTGNPSVIGTTGLSEAQRTEIAEAAESAPILIAPNMSVGVNVLFDLVDRAVRLLGEGFDAEISEIHHRYKVDAPSGTAARLAEVIQEARGGMQGNPLTHGRKGRPGERPPSEIGMHSLRGGDVVGEHTVTLAGLGERLELTHRAQDRSTFARGALRAARWISGRLAGLYGMDDVLKT